MQPAGDESRLLEVYADIAFLRRVFENIIVNALRFTPPEGCIGIEYRVVS